jgi:hypothetical protein
MFALVVWAAPGISSSWREMLGVMKTYLRDPK